MTGHDGCFMLNLLSCQLSTSCTNVPQPTWAPTVPTVQRFQVVAKTFFTNLLSCLLLNFQVKPWLKNADRRDKLQSFSAFLVTFVSWLQFGRPKSLSTQRDERFHSCLPNFLRGRREIGSPSSTGSQLRQPQHKKSIDV